MLVALSWQSLGQNHKLGILGICHGRLWAGCRVNAFAVALSVGDRNVLAPHLEAVGHDAVDVLLGGAVKHPDGLTANDRLLLFKENAQGVVQVPVDAARTVAFALHHQHKLAGHFGKMTVVVVAHFARVGQRLSPDAGLHLAALWAHWDVSVADANTAHSVGLDVGLREQLDVDHIFMLALGKRHRGLTALHGARQHDVDVVAAVVGAKRLPLAAKVCLPFKRASCLATVRQ